MIAITGAPGTGKTTYANSLGSRQVIHTDNFLRYEKITRQKILASTLTFTQYDSVVEGTLVPWALREMLLMYGNVKPVDKLVIMRKQWRPILPCQLGLHHAIENILDDIKKPLLKQGVVITYGSV